MNTLDTLHSIETIRVQKGGVLAVDKPSGISSHTVVNWARKVFGIRKIGHTGTLDPLASGLLVLLIGREFTKKQAYYLRQDKEYIVTARLGIETDTYDSMGRTVAVCDWEQITGISSSEIKKVCASFIGISQQRVPAFSAVKQGGEKMYDLALAGKVEASELPSRSITIHVLSVLDSMIDAEHTARYVTIRVACGSGTYIRSLIHDVGKLLGCGACVTELRRTAIGTMTVSDAEVCPLVPSKYILHKKN